MKKKKQSIMARGWAIVLCFILVTTASIALIVGTNAFAEGSRKQSAESIRITKGPVIEFVNDHSAVIAWSTNVNSKTLLRYGTSDRELTETAENKHGSRTHRVHLIDLEPNTTYFYQVEARQVETTQAKETQEAVSSADSQVKSFRTAAKVEKSRHHSGTEPAA